ncbi:serine hydrolase [Nostoc sp. C117]|uniref:serine hydrolase n=1 Tax=Nostoc sp. C117 TaxID=3349875 RepID=UPI00370DA071
MRLPWFLLTIISPFLLTSTSFASTLKSEKFDSTKIPRESTRDWKDLLANFQSEGTIQKYSIPKLNQPEIFHNTNDTSLFGGIIPLGKEISELKSQVRALMAHYSFLKPGMFFLDIETGNYLNIDGEKVFPAASTIKYPILIALYEQIDAGKVKLDEKLVMRRDLVASGSGDLQYKPSGIKLSVIETVHKMITISDNTATNMIIDRLGGKAKLNQRFRVWGLKNTVIRNMLGDFKGTNTTSPADLVRLSALVDQHKLISEGSHVQVLDILRHCHNNKLLAAGVGKGGTIAHKTGDIGFLVGDAGIIEMPNGKHYLAGIFVIRPHDDERGREFVRQVSRLVYQYLDQPKVSQL